MIFKFLVAIAIAYFGWRLWQGWGRPLPGTPKPPPARPAAGGDHAQALQVLGVAADADEAEIRAAHRRLISAVHPDRGGSAELTRQINAARDHLLQRNN